MSDEFTYAPPDEGAYLKGILVVLKKGHADLYALLKDAKCAISASGTYSRIRWNGMKTTVTFQIPMQQFEAADPNEEKTRVLLRICNQVMPQEAGLDVVDVQLSPLLYNPGDTRSLENDLEDISASLHKLAAEFTLPRDIIERGREMAEVYLYLYAVENYLRLFIEAVANNEYGKPGFDCLNMPKGIARAIEARKEQERRNQWISLRGDSELFYLDFKDLGDLIVNNWGVFSRYFPDQSWITSKIDELGKCRNLVAHNSVVGDHERDVIRVNFRSIVRQLSRFMD